MDNPMIVNRKLAQVVDLVVQVVTQLNAHLVFSILIFKTVNVFVNSTMMYHMTAAAVLHSQLVFT